MSKSIPLSVPCINGNEWKYVKDCLNTEWVSTAGKYVEKFETEFSVFTGAVHAVACVNGTAALQVALRVVGVLPGEEVIVPTLTFIATANSVKYLGAEPVFMDCDDFYNLDIDKTADFLDKETENRDGYTYNTRTGRRIAAIMPVHVFGNAVRMDELVAICRDRNIRVVEDATESLGTFYSDQEGEGRHTGTIGDIGCFSFNGNKIITTGGGGMLITNVAAFAEKAKYLTTQAKDDEVRYVHNEIGYNFRLTNVQAAIGVAQLEVLHDFLKIKRNNFLRYKEKIAAIKGLTLADGPIYAKNNHWMYPLQIDKSIYGKDRDELMDYLNINGIQTRPVWYLTHLQRPYLDCQHYEIDRAVKLHEITLNIPCSTNLQEQDVDSVIERLSHG